MLIDTAATPPTSTLDADVCIIGAGPAGITLASELADAGHSVMVLESGGRGAEPRPQEFNAGDSVGAPHYSLDEARVRGFAGTSNHWFDFGWFRGRPFEQLDFEPRDGVPHSGWPIDRDQVDPFYERAMAWCGLGQYDFRPERYVTDEYPELPWVGDAFETHVFKLSPPPIWSDRYEALVARDEITLVLHATVIHVESDGSMVTGVRVRPTLGGPEFGVHARHYVVATGGLENPRVLLLSRSASHPNGLGNEHDQVGRWFMEHPRVRAGTIVPSDPELVHNTDLYDRHHFDEPDVQIHGKLAMNQGLIRDEGLLNSAFFVQGLPAAQGSIGVRSVVTLKNAVSWRPLPDQLGRHVRNVVAATPDIAAVAAQQFRRRVLKKGRPAPEHLQLEVMCEQAPNPESRVVLSDKRDPFGLPLGRLDWKVGEQELRSVRRTVDILEEVVTSGGHGRMAWKVGDQLPVEPWKGGWHHTGTTRMAVAPTDGVVDEHCRVHGLDNLHVAGSSVFPTAGYANPTLTIIAMTLRLGDHLVERLG